MEIVGGVFNWTVGTALRYMNLSGNSIRFIVYDQFNMSESQSVRIRYCGCEDPSECEFQNEEDDDEEYLNECNDTRIHKCEQECINDVGSYHCACKSGYLLNNDNFTCADVDECVLGNYFCTYPHEECVNLPGAYTCGCEREYSKYNKTSDCVKLESKMFFGYLEYIVHTNNIPKTNDSLQNGIANTSTEFTNILNTVTNFSKIEIYRIYKREDVA
ncbi:hypothetical protein DPMN_023811 [Dreissena polymorpha]|uniref:Vitellogenin receptor n=1 Tax=Dreissena polymorpha TaxID=45954 RepID=A0A9D4LLU2_DREPO|nr:hypothetical protein DPMN_023811 [Dreissena polymorpha]